MLNLNHIKTKAQLKKYYLSLLPDIRRIAREHGYAVGLHGSVQRDLDLIIVPWIKKPKKPESLVIAIEEHLKLTPHKRSWWKEDCLRAGKPLGRKTYSIHIGWWGKRMVLVKGRKDGYKVPKYNGVAYIDISMMGV